jgi:hypothetical protein
MTNPILPFAVLGVSVIFQLMRASSHVVGVVVAATLLAIAAYPTIEAKMKSKPDPAVALMEREHKEALVPAIETPNYSVSKIPKKGYKYLEQNPPLIALVHSLRIVRMYERPRYQELIQTLDNYQKIYIYILGQRIQPSQGVPLFHDMRARVLSLLYSCYFVVPMQLKHVYGIHPHDRIKECVAEFTALSSKMNSVLRDFVRLELKQNWTFSDVVAAANQFNDPSALP